MTLLKYPAARRSASASSGLSRAVAVLLPLLLASCAKAPLGYGVLLSGDPSGPFATGALLTVSGQSQGAVATYLVRASGDRTPREIPAGKVRFFLKRDEATRFAASYGSYLTTYAFSRKEDSPPLPMREKPNSEAQIVYKLRYGELVKVVSRTEEKDKAGSYEDYWYELVTEDGTVGFCFGHYLKVFSGSADPAAETQRLLAQDPTLERLLGNVWRPDYFSSMIDRNRIDLARFREDIGLFPEPDRKQLRLVLPKETVLFRYEKVEKAGSTYIFAGTELRVAMEGEDRITLSYRHKDQMTNAVYTMVSGNVAILIEAEKARRRALYDEFRSKGATWRSSAYGTIRLEDGMRFRWDGFERIVPGLVRRGVAGSGSVDFPYWLSKALSEAYQGVVAFDFDDPDQEPVCFLYVEKAGGIQLTSMDRSSLVDMDVRRPPVSPTIIFFSREGD